MRSRVSRFHAARARPSAPSRATWPPASCRATCSACATSRTRLGRTGGACAPYEALREQCGDDRQRFARHWHAIARRWRFEELNELIREHNEWYPVESGLPLDPRTRDYVRMRGRSYRRDELGPEWVLDRFPA